MEIARLAIVLRALAELEPADLLALADELERRAKKRKPVRVAPVDRARKEPVVVDEVTAKRAERILRAKGLT